jgi:hypothetical protein
VKVAIMQPYFFPYIGYFQLMNAVDEFIVYDNIQFTKKGWINRNRILANNKDTLISVNIKKDSDYLIISDRQISDAWTTERNKILNKIKEAYRKAPFFTEVFPLLENCLLYEEKNLFNFLHYSLVQTKEFLLIDADIITSSLIDIDHELKAEKKVIEICKARNSNYYINPIGGLDLYDKKEFKNEGINLHFLKSSDIKYNQSGHDFVPYLSIIDIMMFNSREQITKYLNSHFSLQ